MDTCRNEFASLADDLGRNFAYSRDCARASSNLGDDAWTLPWRVLDRTCSVGAWRSAAMAGNSRIFKSVVRNCGITSGLNWPNAIRARVRSGGTIGAACLS